MSAPLFDGAPAHPGSLVTELRRVGAIRSAAWAEAFARVPRHVFVPEWYGQETDSRGITVWRRHDAADRDAWEAAVYGDQTLVTALDPETAERVDERAWTGIPTSSSTLPSLMAQMLEDLGVVDGHRVLEVGTGTGYNAALLGARLGDRLVHSVDVSPDVVEAARGRLASLGYRPHLAAGDGQRGFPGHHAPFDRIIATCSVPRIPAAWVEQTRPGGTILTDVAMGIEGGLVRLTVDDERRAVGHFTTTTGRFMAARGDAHAYRHPGRAPYAPRAGAHPASLTAADIRAHYPFRLLLAIHIPDAELVYHVDDETGAMSLQLQRRDGTWARAPIADDPTTVTYGGNADLWRRAEAAWQWWNDHDRPAQDRFGYVREADGHHYVWHLPDGHRWSLGC
ncbi:methyltransferase domain-containing protein [Streptomyces antioxidans]|uniref:methyltransferase domain-containing protein n=1 Tax=Streptomyces antioxidans TaxID=1507734 RepID=UPI00069D04DF|nr:methyltransferase domain-containing protein [Streptomyces antioxidans]